MNIFILEVGEYSDRRNVGVYSSEDKAKEIGELEYKNDYIISEMVLDELYNYVKGGWLWYTFRMTDSGDIFDESSQPICTYLEFNRIFRQIWDRSCLVAQVHAESREKALHIAGDLRREFLQSEVFKSSQGEMLDDQPF